VVSSTAPRCALQNRLNGIDMDSALLGLPPSESGDHGESGQPTTGESGISGAVPTRAPLGGFIANNLIGKTWQFSVSLGCDMHELRPSIPTPASSTVPRSDDGVQCGYIARDTAAHHQSISSQREAYSLRPMPAARSLGCSKATRCAASPRRSRVAHERPEAESPSRPCGPWPKGWTRVQG